MLDSLELDEADLQYGFTVVKSTNLNSHTGRTVRDKEPFVDETRVFMLLPSPEQKDSLLQMMKAFNAGVQFAADRAFELDQLNKVELQTVLYPVLRADFGLTSQMAVRAISAGVETIKSQYLSAGTTWRRKAARQRVHEAVVRSPIDPYANVLLDTLLVGFKSVHHVTIRCLHDREKIPWRFCYYAIPKYSSGPMRGELQYVKSHNVFFLFQHIPAPVIAKAFENPDEEPDEEPEYDGSGDDEQGECERAGPKHLYARPRWLDIIGDGQ